MIRTDPSRGTVAIATFLTLVAWLLSRRGPATSAA
jgi:hypothetical protein